MTARVNPAARLRAGMAEGIVMAPGAADALTARLVERAVRASAPRPRGSAFPISA